MGAEPLETVFLMQRNQKQFREPRYLIFISMSSVSVMGSCSIRLLPPPLASQSSQIHSVFAKHEFMTMYRHLHQQT